MKINLSPVRGEVKTELSVTGSTITLNGEEFNLSLLEDGATAEHGKLGMVSRSGNDYELTVVQWHGKNASEEVRFPKPLTITGDYTHEYEAGEF